MAKITAVIITKNEEDNIIRCLESINFCDEIFIVDDFSSDQTLEKIKSQNIRIYKRKLDGDFAAQRNFAMQKAKNDWILFIDADEILTEALRKEIVTLLKGYIVDKTLAFYIKRRDYFWGKEIKYGEIASVRNNGLIRLVRKNSGKWEGKVHEKFEILNTKYEIQKLNNFIDHYPHQTVKDFLQQVNFYSTLRAVELLKKGKITNIFEIIFFPIGKFLYTYILKLGFLDGAQGFTYSFFMSFHSFLVRTKLYQYTNIDKQK